MIDPLNCFETASGAAVLPYLPRLEQPSFTRHNDSQGWFNESVNWLRIDEVPDENSKYEPAMPGKLRSFAQLNAVTFILAQTFVQIMRKLLRELIAVPIVGIKYFASYGFVNLRLRSGSFRLLSVAFGALGVCRSYLGCEIYVGSAGLANTLQVFFSPAIGTLRLGTCGVGKNKSFPNLTGTPFVAFVI